MYISFLYVYLLLQWSMGCAMSAKQVQLSVERLSKLLAPLTWMSEFLLKQILRIQIYGLRHPKSMMVSLKIPNWAALDLIFEQSDIYELGVHRHLEAINKPAIPSWATISKTDFIPLPVTEILWFSIQYVLVNSTKQRHRLKRFMLLVTDAVSFHPDAHKTDRRTRIMASSSPQGDTAVRLKYSAAGGFPNLGLTAKLIRAD